MFDSYESIWKPLWSKYPECVVEHTVERTETGWSHEYHVFQPDTGASVERQVWLETAAGVWTREG